MYISVGCMLSNIAVLKFQLNHLPSVHVSSKYSVLLYYCDMFIVSDIHSALL